MEVNKEKVKVVHPFVCNDAVKLLRTVLDDFNFLLKHIKTNFNKVGFEANVFITPFLRPSVRGVHQYHGTGLRQRHPEALLR